MKLRTPEHWRAVVEAIADPVVRLVVANIVWWDWFGLRTIEQRWPHLDEYLSAWKVKAPPEAKAKDVRAALVQVGYRDKEARARV